MMVRRMVCLAVVWVLGGSLAAAQEPAIEVVGWWRMDAPIGEKLGGKTLANAAGDKQRDAVGHTWEGGSLTAFHELPGRYIYDPLTGRAYENVSSIRLVTGKQRDGAGQSDYLEVAGPADKLQPGSFTIEGFLMIGGAIDKWHTLLALKDPRFAHPHAWSLDTESLKGDKKLRYGGHKAPKGLWGVYDKNPSVTQAGWHHVAYVFDQTGDKPRARLYWDGQLVSEASPAAPAYTNSQRLYIGGAPGLAGWNGFLDEVRLTASALTPEQFLQASDTPGKPQGRPTPVALGLRLEPLKPLAEPIRLDLPPPVVGPAQVHVPEDAGLINVKTQYNAKGDGMTDDTAAIRQAVAENVGKHRTLYFPPGVYVLSEPIDWRGNNGEFNAFLTWQGAGMGRTFLYLRDEAAPFGSASQPRALTRPGSIPGRGSQADGGGNRAHNNYILDMTFVIGKGNPGAIGVDFNASNTGAMENVRIVALGEALEGLRLKRQVGPLLIKNVEVHGFDVGVRLGGDLYGSTLHNIHLAGQKKLGLLNEGHLVALQGLSSRNSVPAVCTKGEKGNFANAGLLVLVDAVLQGGRGEASAIEAESAVMIRNVKAEGYGAAVSRAGKAVVSDNRVDEHVWPAPVTLASAPARTLNLPAGDWPDAADRAQDQWCNVGQFLSDEQKKTDASEAIQKAIDSGASVVYFPPGSCRIAKPVIVRGNVRRIVGYQSWLLGPAEQGQGQGLIVFENTRPVTFERFNLKQIKLEVRTGQGVAVRHIIGLSGVTLTHDRAAVFSENTVGGAIALRAGQSWSARQLNIETKGPPAMVENRGGTFWALGYKTEMGNTVLRATEGGKAEILGGLWYPAQGVKDPKLAAIEVDHADVSVSLADLAKWVQGQYPVEVRHTRDGQTDELTRDKLPVRWGLSGLVSLLRASPGNPPNGKF